MPTKFDDFDVATSIIDDLSKYMFNGDNGTPFFRHTIACIGFYDRHDAPSDDISCGLFNFTFEENAKQWCDTLPTGSIHSFDHMFKELLHAFILYDCK